MFLKKGFPRLMMVFLFLLVANKLIKTERLAHSTDFLSDLQTTFNSFDTAPLVGQQSIAQVEPRNENHIGTIAFVDAENSAWLSNFDGTNKRPLPGYPSEIRCRSAEFSPDGRHFAFTGGERVEDTIRLPLIIVDLLKGESFTLVEHAIEFDWSPDSSKIVYSVWSPEEQNESQGIWVVELDTGETTLLLNPPPISELPIQTISGGHIVHADSDIRPMPSTGHIVVSNTVPSLVGPQWSPNGDLLKSAIVMSSTFVGNYIVSSDGSGTIEVTDFGGGYLGWSPDGSYLVERTLLSVYIRNIDLTLRKEVFNNGEIVLGLPKWSPDGRYLAIVSSETSLNPSPSTLWIYDVLTGVTRSVPLPSDLGGVAAWSLDGTQLLVVGGRSRGIWAISLDGTSSIQIGQGTCVAWQPTSLSSSHVLPPSIVERYLRVISPNTIEIRSERRINEINIIASVSGESYLPITDEPIDGWYPVSLNGQDGWVWPDINEVMELEVVRDCALLETLATVCSESGSRILNGSQYVIDEIKRVGREMEGKSCETKVSTLFQEALPERGTGDGIRRSLQETFGENVRFVINTRELAENATQFVDEITSIDVSGPANIVFGYYMEVLRQTCGAVAATVFAQVHEDIFSSIEQAGRSFLNFIRLQAVQIIAPQNVLDWLSELQQMKTEGGLSVVDLPDDVTQRVTGMMLAFYVSVTESELTVDLLADIASSTDLR